jgi:hypothetical protein
LDGATTMITNHAWIIAHEIIGGAALAAAAWRYCPRKRPDPVAWAPMLHAALDDTPVPVERDVYAWFNPEVGRGG